MSYRNIFLAAASLSLLTSFSAGAEECPTLDTGNIGEAACSSPGAPFLPGKLDSVAFAATTPCPVALGAKKMLQSIFKGKKEYPASDTKVMNSGEARCTYKLTEEWKKALKSKEDTLVLRVVFPNREHANYWSVPTFSSKCPMLTASDLDNIEHGSITAVAKDERYSYHFEVVKFDKNLFKNPFSNPNLTELRGTHTIQTPYEVKCQYTYHSGKEETKIELVGKQAK